MARPSAQSRKSILRRVGLVSQPLCLAFPFRSCVYYFSSQFPQTLAYKLPHSLTDWWDRLCCILEVWQVHVPSSQRVQKVSALPAEESKPEFVSSLLGGAIIECLTTLALNLLDCENKGRKVPFPRTFPGGVFTWNKLGYPKGGLDSPVGRPGP